MTRDDYGNFIFTVCHTNRSDGFRITKLYCDICIAHRLAVANRFKRGPHLVLKRSPPLHHRDSERRKLSLEVRRNFFGQQIEMGVFPRHDRFTTVDFLKLKEIRLKRRHILELKHADAIFICHGNHLTDRRIQIFINHFTPPLRK